MIKTITTQFPQSCLNPPNRGLCIHALMEVGFGDAGITPQSAQSRPLHSCWHSTSRDRHSSRNVSIRSIAASAFSLCLSPSQSRPWNVVSIRPIAASSFTPNDVFRKYGKEKVSQSAQIAASDSALKIGHMITWTGSRFNPVNRGLSIHACLHLSGAECDTVVSSAQSWPRHSRSE